MDGERCTYIVCESHDPKLSLPNILTPNTTLKIIFLIPTDAQENITKSDDLKVYENGVIDDNVHDFENLENATNQYTNLKRPKLS